MTSQKLIGFARKELDRLGYIHTPNDWYRYKHSKTKAGFAFVSCRLSLGSGRKNELHIFIRFNDPEKAILAGFRCNKYSGKYNFLFNTTKNEISYVLEHIL